MLIPRGCSWKASPEERLVIICGVRSRIFPLSTPDSHRST
jgi:hypothetical protein